MCRLRLLQAITDLPEEHLRRGLAHLQAAEFLYEAQLFPDLEYTFKHALTHEVAYQGLLHDRQRALHARIVEAIERLVPERVAEQAERLAHHALRGELWEKAVSYLRQAGLRAIARAAYREAIIHLEQALEALRHLPQTRETTELTIDLHIDARHALRPLGERRRIGDHLHEAEGLARTLGDSRRLGRIATFMVSECVDTGDYDRAIRFGEEALSIARTLGDRSIEVAATTFLGFAHAARGEFNEAAALLEGNVALEGDLRYERFETPTIQSAMSGARLADVLSSSAGSTRPSSAVRPPCRSLKRPIILTRCTSGCWTSASPTSVAGISRAASGSSRGTSISAEGGRSPSGDRSPPRPSAPPTHSPAGLMRHSRWSSGAVGEFRRRQEHPLAGRIPSKRGHDLPLGPAGSTRPEATPTRP